jgi:hypothetical protein
VAKMPDGSFMLPKVLMIQYCKVLTDFAKLSYSNLQKHPFYKKKFFRQSSFTDQREHIFKYVDGIMNYIKKIYRVESDDSMSQLPKKLYEDYKDFIRRWGRISTEEELEIFTDHEYNNAYMYGKKKDQSNSNNSKHPKEDD